MVLRTVLPTIGPSGYIARTRTAGKYHPLARIIFGSGAHKLLHGRTRYHTIRLCPERKRSIRANEIPSQSIDENLYERVLSQAGNFARFEKSGGRALSCSLNCN